jgi:tight adherence protein B
VKRPGLILVAAAVVAAATSLAAAAGAAVTPSLRLTPIGRVAFPDRKYVVDLPADAAIAPSHVRVTENGLPVRDLLFSPLQSSGLKSAVVLAIDASDSMAGAPAEAAVDAARAFVDRRGPNEQVGLVTFNGAVHVLEPPTTDAAALRRTLAHPLALAYGTHIFDAIDGSLAALRHAGVPTGAIVVLSDGTDVGSNATVDAAVREAAAQHVRVFTVGLQSKTFDASTLQSIATRTGASYAEATSAAQLKPIYSELSKRLADEYLLQYRSVAAPQSHVVLRVTLEGAGTGNAEYSAPTPSQLPPFHRSLLSRFLLSGLSLAFLVLLVIGLLGYALSVTLERGRSRLVERIHAFGSGGVAVAAKPGRKSPHRRIAASGSRHASGWIRKLERDLDIANMDYRATSVVAGTLVATLLLVVVFSLIATPMALLGMITPFVARSFIGRKLRGVRDEFSEQLPTNLHVLASALRAGHSFAGALAVTVDNSEEPSRRELRRVVSDDRLGIPTDEALRRGAERMASRDLEQVALVAELQRTTGGNIAEVLDTVVETIRDRQDVRRMAQTLTAQGRMARWILSGLPVVTGLAFYVIDPDVMKPMLVSTGGQFALVFAAMMIVAGSFVIQRVIQIEV